MRFELVEKQVVYNLPGYCHSLAVLDGKPFGIGVQVAVPPVGQSLNLGLPIIGFGRTDRINVNSKWASVDCSNPNMHQCME